MYINPFVCGVILKKKINKLLTFYNNKSRAKSTGSFFMP